MTRPLFSVVIPTYGRPEFLAEAIGSVLAQTVNDFECIVVDDASPTPVAIPDDPRLRLVQRNSNGGPAAARNTGIAHASGDFLAFLDDDDLFAPERLEVALEGLNRAPVATCWSKYLSENPGTPRVLEGDVSDSILDHMTPHLGATAVRRDIIEFLDERFSAVEDVEWWLRMARKSNVATVPRFANFIRKHRTPRHRTGAVDRISASHMLLEIHADYFSQHPKAAAFRWKRIGLMSLSVGETRSARFAFRRSLRLRPELRTTWHLIRSVGLPDAHRVPAA